MKLRTKNSETEQGPKTPFSPLASPIAVALTQALKHNEDYLSDSLIEALEKTPNCMVALDAGEPIFITSGDAVNYSIPLESNEFFALVAKVARSAGIKGLQRSDIKKAIESLALSATLDAPAVDVSLYNERLDEDDPSLGVVLNMNSIDGKALVLADGEVRTTEEQTGITFRYAPKNGSLAYKQQPINHEEVVYELKRMFSNLDDAQFSSVMAYAGFILSHPRTNGLTFPILYIHGSAGTGKTTIARLLTKLLGLGDDTVKAQPKDGRDLVATVAQNYMICFDNCGGINDKLANAMCSIATGGTVDDRKLYTNTEIVATRFHQPMIMTSISFPKQYDLSTRALFTKAGKPKVVYSSDTEIYRKLDDMLPHAQAWLLDVTAKAMTYLPEVNPISNHRASDFNTFLAGFEKALGINDQSVQQYVNTAQEEALNQQVVEHDELLASVVSVVKQHGCFAGGPSEVHRMLMNSILGSMRRLPRNWPQNASSLTNRLNRIKDSLEKHGVEVISGGPRGTHGRKLTLRKIEAVEVVAPTLAPEPMAEEALIADLVQEELVMEGLSETAEPVVEMESSSLDLDLDLNDVQHEEIKYLNPADEAELDELMLEDIELNTAPTYREMTQAESDAALSDFLG
ncbi:hypothetical protein LWM38_12060 [Vibrio kanaloae]|uniref:hypothetical protein n=1 Tax=Vibrio kanaloae TaxID=170673 RepID=UPI001F2A1C19|nr:hypothetical protein [Vibrio kanaloae]UIJ40441.1 hypothetical protein LWM38_12060 [Vibrio kanaloae]